MRELDETDLEILQLLLSNARRPYSDIGEHVGLSAPAVSDRVTRLQEAGIINRFTIDVDRSQLRSGIPVLVTLETADGVHDLSAIKGSLMTAGAVEHVFTTAAGDVLAFARPPDPDVVGWLDTLVDAELVEDIDVTLLTGVDWSPDLGGAEFALTCAQCGNTVDSEGTATRIDGDLYQFCCSSCESRFVSRYEELQEGAA
jgi:DNA-binding Lrp family transcriptional regulator